MKFQRSKSTAHFHYDVGHKSFLTSDNSAAEVPGGEAAEPCVSPSVEKREHGPSRGHPLAPGHPNQLCRLPSSVFSESCTRTRQRFLVRCQNRHHLSGRPAGDGETRIWIQGPDLGVVSDSSAESDLWNNYHYYNDLSTRILSIKLLWFGFRKRMIVTPPTLQSKLCIFIQN